MAYAGHYQPIVFPHIFKDFLGFHLQPIISLHAAPWWQPRRCLHNLCNYLEATSSLYKPIRAVNLFDYERRPGRTPDKIPRPASLCDSSPTMLSSLANSIPTCDSLVATYPLPT